MMKWLTGLMLMFVSFNSAAQNLESTRAIQLISKNLDAAGLSYEALANSQVVNAFVNSHAGTEMVYLQQMHKGLPVFNQIQVLAFKNEKLVSNAGSRLWEIAEASGHASAIPAIQAASAIQTAAAAKKINVTGVLNPVQDIIPGRKYLFGKPSTVTESITAELMWVPIGEGKKVRLAWQVYLVPANSSDYWLIRVDAASNRVLEENNLTVYCNFHHTHEKIGTIHAREFYGFDRDAAGKVKTAGKPGGLLNWNAASGNSSPLIVNGASYRVIPFPAESPKHPGGNHALVTNPWEAAPGNASSLKWHSNGTDDYNITRGNNVWAKEDWDANNGTVGSSATSTTPDPLSFNFTPDFLVSPTQTTPVQNQQFNITNLFYWNNIVHDIVYLYGFDEVSGNFQVNNQGRGGAGNDAVNADAQDGNFVAPNQNNANFSTPPDGGSGRMQMYLWNAVPGFLVNTPASIAGSYTSLESNFSTNNKLINVGPRTGDVVYYNDNSAGTTHEACVAPANGAALAGKIALIDRGNCNFTDKVKNAQNAGAIAVVMVNNVAGSPIIMGGTDNTITIPAVMISDVDGLLIKAQLTNGVNVTLSAPVNLDGDVDNGVIVHEFGHGISNRLTGGPSQATCVSNAEQMGEGWSDYYALMLTQDWATANVNTGFTQSRGIGTYVVGQNPSGLGIRSKKYSTDFTVNDLVYAGSISAQQHERGELWCATLWDMTWNIIQQTNSIAPSIYQSGTNAGNVIALKLVTEAMKLQPCNPGFIDGRNAILRADSILYNGQFNCAIREAFRRRGMGLKASQGSANNVNDQTPDFTPYITVTLNESATQVPEGQQVTFTTVISSCSPVSNYVLRDTLPDNVTYISGGTYDAGNRVVSFPVDFTSGSTQTYAFTVQVNAGTYYTPETYFTENVSGSSIPASWTANSTTGNAWIVSNAQSSSAPNSFFSPNAAVSSDQRLETTAATALGTGNSSFSFSNYFNTQAGFDGGVVEVSTDNGTTWTDLSNRIVAGYYNGVLAAGSGNPIANRQAWTGNNSNFMRSSVNLTGLGGQSVKFRFRFGSNNSTAGTGWYVDDIVLKREAAVNVRSSLFNAAGIRQMYTDTVALIIQTPTCVNVNITSQPTDVQACTGSNVAFTVVNDGTTPAYQWQLSTDGGNTWNDVSGATAATLTVNNVTTGMNNHRYRVQISNVCPSSSISAAAVLTVSDPALISGQPSPLEVCEGSNASFTVTASGTANTYQWQVSTDGGITYTNIAAATAATLNLSSVSAAQNNTYYRARVLSCDTTGQFTQPALLTVNGLAVVAAQPLDVSACIGSNAVFSISVAGTNPAYQWQVSTDGGNTWADITGETASTLTVSNVTLTQSGYRYRALVSNLCTTVFASTSALLSVSNAAGISVQPQAVTACEGNTASFNVTATGTSYQWQVSTDGGTTFTDIAGANSTSLLINGVTIAQNGNLYRLVASGCGSNPVSSNAALLSVNSAVAVTTQPSDITVCSGNTASFTVTASGTNPVYQWELSTDGGLNYTAVAGANSASLSIPGITPAQNGHLYRVVVSNTCTSALLSNPALLTVTAQAILVTQPASTQACPGASASFSVGATGPGLTYQWQLSTDGGANWSDISAATNASISINNIQSTQNNHQYRVLVGSSCSTTGTASDAATLTVLASADITQQPVAVDGCIGANATFTVNANGTGLTYQWQVSTDAGQNWFDLTGETASSLVLTNIQAGQNNNRYRVLVSANPCGAVSDAAILTVRPSPLVTLTASPYRSLYPGLSTTLTASSVPAGTNYAWYKNGVLLSGVNGNTLSIGFDDRGTYTVSDLDGCANLSNELLIRDSASQIVFIYPNPNQGQFTVRFFNGTNITQAMIIQIYDEKGARVYSKSFNVNTVFDKMNVDIRNLSQGTYFVDLRDRSGVRLGTGKVIKQ